MIVDEIVKDVIRRTCLGMDNKAIAESLGLTASRVKSIKDNEDFKVALEVYDKEIRGVTTNFKQRLEVMANEAVLKTHDLMRDSESERIAQISAHFLIDKHIDVSGLGQKTGTTINLYMTPETARIIDVTSREIEQQNGQPATVSAS